MKLEIADIPSDFRYMLSLVMHRDMIDKWLVDPVIFDGLTPLDAFSVESESKMIENLVSVLSQVRDMVFTLNTGPLPSDEEIVESMKRARENHEITTNSKAQ